MQLWRREISFDAPSKDWSARQNKPTLNLYLYDIREDLERRTVQYQEIREKRDGREIVVDRRLPPRKFKLSYMITAWTQRAEDEHRLLSAVLSCFIRSDALPQDVLQGTLAEVRPPATAPEAVRVTVALPPPQDRSISDVWTALGGELKPSLDLIVTAPFDTRRKQPVGEPVTEGPSVTMGDLTRPDGEVEHASKKASPASERVPLPAKQEGKAAKSSSGKTGKSKAGRRLDIQARP